MSMSMSQNIRHIHRGHPLHAARGMSDLRQMLDDCAERYRGRVAFRFRADPHAPLQTKTYDAFRREAEALGTALLMRGLADRHVAVIGENRYEWSLSYLATVSGVGVVIPLDRLLPASEIERMLERGEVDALICSRDFEDIARDIASRSERLSLIAVMNPKEGAPESHDPRFTTVPALLSEGFAALAGGNGAYRARRIDPDAMNVLLFTSGTSSSAKAVMLSHRNLISDVLSLAGIMAAKAGDTVLSILPLHHTFENTCGLLFTLYQGMTIAISDGLKHLNRNLVEHAPTILVGVPMLFDKFRSRISEELRKRSLEKKVGFMMKASRLPGQLGTLLKRKLFGKLLAPLGGKLRLIVTGGAGMDANVAQWYEDIGVRVYQGYGLTETSPVIAGCNDRIRRPGTCGQPLPNTEIGILDPDREGSGEIVVRSPMVMLGYWNDEESTRECRIGDWFRTGDLGSFDRRGLLRVTGRAKSMIVLKNGKKVFPEEIESLLNRVAMVKESMVWGEKDDAGNVTVCSKLVLDPDRLPRVDGAIDDAEVCRLLDEEIKAINRSLSSYKAVRHFVYTTEELAKTTTLKVKRYVEAEALSRLFRQMAANLCTSGMRNLDRIRELLAASAAEPV